MEAADEVDALVEARVLVHGSLPPGGRDLDILARPPEMNALLEGLPARGYVRKGNELARFRGGTVDLVDMAPSSWWQLPEDETAGVFHDALSIPGYRNLVRPAGHHMLLILTRRLVEGKGLIDDKRRAYVERALDDDPAAWTRAAQHAPVWGAASGLVMLRRMFDEGAQLGRADRARAIAERLESLGRSRRRAQAAAWKETMPRPKRARVISVSGTDGSGKSTQAEMVAGALQQLGYDARAQWTKLGETPWIWRVARPVKRVLLWATRTGKSSTLPPPSPDRYGPDAGTELRRKSPWLTQLWATTVALSNVLTHRRIASGLGSVVVCDRYVLDSVVNLRARYGADKRFGFQGGLVRALSPRPVLAFLLRVPPHVAHERRRDEHTIEELERLAALYDEETQRVLVHVVDAARPVDEICAELARDSWLAL